MDYLGSHVVLRRRLATELGKESPEFERQLLLRCISPWKRLPARCLLALWPKVFKPDLEVMRDAGDTWDLDQVKALVVELKKPRSGWSVFRDGLKLRASGRRLVHLAAAAFQAERSASAPLRASATAPREANQPDATPG